MYNEDNEVVFSLLVTLHCGIIVDKTINNNDKMVYIAIYASKDYGTNVCHATVQFLAEGLNISESLVKKSLKNLVKEKYIAVRKKVIYLNISY